MTKLSKFDIMKLIINKLKTTNTLPEELESKISEFQNIEKFF